MIWLAAVVMVLALYLVMDLTNELHQKRKEITLLQEALDRLQDP